MTAREHIIELYKRIEALEAEVAALKAAPAGDDLDAELDLSPQTPIAPKPEQAWAQREVDGQLEFAAPSARQLELRTQMLPHLALENLPPIHGLDKDTAEAAYLQGGPLWLYHFDRDYVMGLGPGTRQGMVRDVAMTGDDETAQWFGADLLKARDLDEIADGGEFTREKDRQYRSHTGGAAVPAGTLGTAPS